jgi:hypothetical protein
MRQILLLLIVCLSCFNSRAQLSESFSGHAFYFEFSGHFPPASLNWEMNLKAHGKVKINSRMGFGWWPTIMVDNSIKTSNLGIPLGVVFFTGQGNSHLEGGVGLSYYHIEKFYGPDRSFFLVPTLGYRYQKPTSGIFFRVVASPMIYLGERFENTNPDINVNRKLRGWVGISLGYFLSKAR